MYNNGMFSGIGFVIVLLGICGCVVHTVPLAPNPAPPSTVFIDASFIRQTPLGTSQEDVHQRLEKSLIVGYSYTVAENKDIVAVPLTVMNPYRQESRMLNGKDCVVEYYLTAVQEADGQISDDELMPLVFCQGVLKAKGWEGLR